MRRFLVVLACLLLAAGCGRYGALHEGTPRVAVLASIPKDRALQIFHEFRGDAALLNMSCVLSEAGVRRNDARAEVPYSRLYLHFFEFDIGLLVPFVADRGSKPFHLLPSDFHARVVDGRYNGCTLGSLDRKGGHMPQAEIDKLATAWLALGGRLGD